MIYIGSDHAGFSLKEKIIQHFHEQGISFEDKGTYSMESVDYPTIAKTVVKSLKNNQKALGILICGTGIGMSISANRFKGIRAALCHTELEAKLAKEHNQANILCLGARILGEEQALACVSTFLNSTFQEDRHHYRIHLLDEILNENE